MDRSAFNDLILKYSRQLFIIAFGILKNKQEAEDVVQEVFMKMWIMEVRLNEYNRKDALAATMTRNECIDRLRKWKKIRSNTEVFKAGMSDPSPTPFYQLVNYENSKILRLIIARLPEQYREVVEMKDIRGLSYEEISKINGINISNLRVLLSRGRKIIKEEYLKYNNERRQIKNTAGKIL